MMFEQQLTRQTMFTHDTRHWAANTTPVPNWARELFGAPLCNHLATLATLHAQSMLPPMPTQSCASTRRLVPRVQRGLFVQQQLRTVRHKTKPRSPRALLPLQSADGLAPGAASAAMGLPT